MEVRGSGNDVSCDDTASASGLLVALAGKEKGEGGKYKTCVETG